VSQARRLLAGHSGQTGAAHQHSWLGVHRCRCLEQQKTAYDINPTPAQPPAECRQVVWPRSSTCGGHAALVLWRTGAVVRRRFTWLAYPYPGEIWFASQQR
jgi:hypothetical protein